MLRKLGIALAAAAVLAMTPGGGAQAAPGTDRLDFAPAAASARPGLPVQLTGGTTYREGLRVYTVYGPYTIRAAHSGKCLDIAGGTGSTGNGAIAQQWDCLGSGQTNQQWYFTDTGAGTGNYYVTARHDGKCLDIAGGTGSTGNGAAAQQWDCYGFNQSNQRWWLTSTSYADRYKLVASHSNKCLDIEGGTGSQGNGVRAQQWDCLGDQQANQRWSLVRV
ncbi:RICIN domain-containing protein [Longispora sp. K20-0274]|uniref:RICIN domain-containing protein n=1 Tax=Longispora sp. K20-0274 TaxID=3088255 RepID=UPI00399AC710